MKIKTETLQKMVSKAIQGSSNNKNLPLTSLIGIEAKGDILTLTTTDGSNTFKVNQNIEVDGQIAVSNEFYTIVNAETFSKLVGKTTKEFITLENTENYLEVTGNGTYKLEIAINEEGEMVRFPEVKNIEKEPEEIDMKSLKEALEISKSSVAKTMEVPCLTGYYIGTDKIISTDRQLVCDLKKELVKEPLLISSEMAELLKLVDEEKVNLLKEDNNLIFYTDTITISGKELEGKEIYPVQAIEGLTKLEYSNNIKVNRMELLSVLDRLSLFISDYDKNGVHLAFTKEALLVKSQKSNAQELIDGKCTCEEEYNVLVDIEMLKNQLESLQEENVTIYFGQDKSIELKEKDTILVLSLLEKTE